LYHDSQGRSEKVESYVPNDREPDILKDEIRKGINKLQNNKATGPDEIMAEILKATGEKGLDIVHGICTNIWITGTWPEDRIK
jgi:hypothetical protein